MQYYAGLDVSLEETWVCIMSQSGEIIAEGAVPSEVEDIALYLKSLGFDYDRIGLEAGPTSAWLYQGLIKEDLPVICIDPRHANAALKVQQVKTDKHDARGIAHIMRTGWYRVSHVKSIESQKIRVLLNARKILLNKRMDIDNQVRGMLKVFGHKIGPISAIDFSARVYELIEGDSELIRYIEPLISVRESLFKEFKVLDKHIRDIARNDVLCRRFMSVPGVGPLTALLFKATIDNPYRFKKSANVGVHLGLTPRKYASGEIDYNGGITKCGDPMMRVHLYEAAQVILRRTSKPTALKKWGSDIAKRTSRKVAMTAVARKLAVILHRMWVDETEFCDEGLKQA